MKQVTIVCYKTSKVLDKTVIDFIYKDEHGYGISRVEPIIGFFDFLGGSTQRLDEEVDINEMLAEMKAIKEIVEG